MKNISYYFYNNNVSNFSIQKDLLNHHIKKIESPHPPPRHNYCGDSRGGEVAGGGRWWRVIPKSPPPSTLHGYYRHRGEGRDETRGLGGRRGVGGGHEGRFQKPCIPQTSLYNTFLYPNPLMGVVNYLYTLLVFCFFCSSF